MATYRTILDVPRELIWFVAGLLRAERKARGTRRNARLLTCYRQALFGIAWFREKKDIPTLGLMSHTTQPAPEPTQQHVPQQTRSPTTKIV